jgi:hypothetical protein
MAITSKAAMGVENGYAKNYNIDMMAWRSPIHPASRVCDHAAATDRCVIVK